MQNKKNIFHYLLFFFLFTSCGPGNYNHTARDTKENAKYLNRLEWYFIKNKTTDTIVLSYYAFSLSNVDWRLGELEDCLIKEELYQNPPILYDSQKLTAENLNLVVNSSETRRISIIIPPNSIPVCIGSPHFGKNGIDLIIGDGCINFRNNCFNFFNILTYYKFEKKSKKITMTIDSSITNIPVTNVSSGIYSDYYSNTKYEKVGTNVIVVTVGGRRKTWWMEYYSQGKIDSVNFEGIMFNKNCK